MTEIEQLKAQLKAAQDKAAAEANNALELAAQFNAAKAENERLVKLQTEKVFVKSNLEKGTVSVYGINAIYPMSAYPEGWEKVLSIADAIRAECAKPEVKAAAAKSKAAKVAERLAKKTSPAAKS